MTNKAKPNVKKQGGVTFELLHQPNFKRTIFLLYLKVPANYIVRLKNKETTFVKFEDEKKASEALIAEISEYRQRGATNENLEKIKEKHKKKWEADHVEKDQHLSSVFTFCIYDSPGTRAHLQDFKFFLPNADHDVKVSITKYKKADEDLKALKDLMKDLKIR